VIAKMCKKIETKKNSKNAITGISELKKTTHLHSTLIVSII